MLPGKWNAYDGNSHQGPKDKMYDRYVEPTQQYPDDIEKKIQASIPGPFKIKGLAKRGQWKDTQFYELNPEGYSYDGKTDNQSSQEIKKTNEYTPAEYQP